MTFAVRSALRASLCAAALVLAFTTTNGQEHDHDHAALGHVNFPIACAPQAQEPFNTAVALLYSFFWERVDAAVAEVLKADPNCGMAHWAKAVASLENALGAPPTRALERE